MYRKNPEKLELPSGLKSGPISIHCGPTTLGFLKEIGSQKGIQDFLLLRISIILNFEIDSFILKLESLLESSSLL